MRNPKEEIRLELLAHFQLGHYSNFMRRVKQTGFDIAAHFQTIQLPFLHVAARKNETGLMVFLIAHGFDVNAADFDGDTPLHMASNYHAQDAVELLLSKGVEISPQNNCGDTPLHNAVMAHDIKIVRRLVRADADMHLSNYFFNVPGMGDVSPKQVAELERYRGGQAEVIYQYFQDSLLLFADRYEVVKKQNRPIVERVLAGKTSKGFDAYSPIDILLLENGFDNWLKKNEAANLRPALLKHAAPHEKTLRLLHMKGKLHTVMNEALWRDAATEFEVFAKSLPKDLLKKYKNKIDFTSSCLYMHEKKDAPVHIRRRPKNGPK